ncbi:hypothetical protein DFH06DRAFT_1346405 [Mycena polygramma]|nr:hypothetical protein DFH06DRAFT_1346405 [Mycena polygramma]
MTTNDSSAEDTRAHVGYVPTATAKTPLQLALDGLVAAYTSAYPGGVLTPLTADKNQEIEDAIQVLLDLEAPKLSPIQPTASKPPSKARSSPSTRPRTSKPPSPSPLKAVSSATSSLKRKLSTGRSSVLDEGFQLVEGGRDSKRPKLTRKPEDGEVILVEDSDEEIDELSDSEEEA